MTTAARRTSNAAVNPPVGLNMGRRDSRWDGLRRLTLSSVHRLSVAGSGSRRPTITRALAPMKMENSYRIDCQKDQRFNGEVVRGAVEEVLRDTIGDEPYDPERCRYLAKRLAGLIKSSVRDLGYVRYKLVVMVFLGPRGQEADLAMASRCLWRPESGDSFVDALYENRSQYAQATVFASYYE